MQPAYSLPRWELQRPQHVIITKTPINKAIEVAVENLQCNRELDGGFFRGHHFYIHSVGRISNWVLLSPRLEDFSDVLEAFQNPADCATSHRSHTIQHQHQFLPLASVISYLLHLANSLSLVYDHSANCFCLCHAWLYIFWRLTCPSYKDVFTL